MCNERAPYQEMEEPEIPEDTRRLLLEKWFDVSLDTDRQPRLSARPVAPPSSPPPAKKDSSK